MKLKIASKKDKKKLLKCKKNKGFPCDLEPQAKS
jgi:hypothetical protein